MKKITYHYIVETYKSKFDLMGGLTKQGKDGWRAISIQRFETNDTGIFPYYWDVVYEKQIEKL